MSKTGALPGSQRQLRASGICGSGSSQTEQIAREMHDSHCHQNSMHDINQLLSVLPGLLIAGAAEVSTFPSMREQLRQEVLG